MWGGRRGGGGEEGCTPLPAPTTSTRPGCGDHPGMASPLTTESQSQSPLLPDSHSVCCRPAGGPAPSPLQPHFGFAQAAGENSCPLAFGGGAFWLSSSCHGTTKPLLGPLTLRHSWTHPVPSTLSPHAVLVQSAPFYYIFIKEPSLSQLQTLPPKVAKTMIKVPPELNCLHVTR